MINIPTGDVCNYTYYATAVGNITVIANSINSGNELAKSIFNVNKMDTWIVSFDDPITAYQSKKFVITLIDNADKVLPNKTITFTMKGKTYTRTTDANGNAYITLYSTEVGSFNLDIRYAGDENYTASYPHTVKITVKPAYVTVKQLISTAKYLTNYGKKYKKLPSTVKIGSVKYSIAQASYLMMGAFKKVVAKKSLNTKIKMINVKVTMKNSKGEIKSLKRYYPKIFNNIYKKAIKGKLPTTIKVNGRTVAFNQYTFSIAKILTFGKLKYRLPNYVVFSGKYQVYTKGL